MYALAYLGEMAFDGSIAGWAIFGGIGIREARPAGVVAGLDGS
jgi:hypothetical protein